ncbi:hypothetical protein BO70DRAFT_365750 [Aspergillus heteromorphus CBS 117.55]|uniref:SnoaL-like domain-containing protein n=1 Tax=Aspergillus heteromorphus CBS 117.55 TaxID=1448321 RepID=A0A317V619_9EURO|nr:uncharacterized protein BO70DRAFT_365750 [Aspergillus heteromorphus CBS 117.55]PWY69496.1 hypothetical protein BO70DRAFT_365750 [Aspergillus heteromorphus CBS 117.55]
MSPPESDTHTSLATLAKQYFQCVDTDNPAGAASLFSPTATFTVVTEHTTFTGREEIQAMLTRFSAQSKSMEHRVRNIVVDEKTRRVATEQRYTGELSDGTKQDMVNCNFFDVDQEGRFTRVMVWMAGGSPLGGREGL